MQRDGSSREAAQARVSAQMPVASKAEMADIVIDNNGAQQGLEGRVGGVQLLQMLLASAAAGWLLQVGCCRLAAAGWLLQAQCLASKWRWTTGGAITACACCMAACCMLHGVQQHRSCCDMHTHPAAACWLGQMACHRHHLRRLLCVLQVRTVVQQVRRGSTLWGLLASPLALLGAAAAVVLQIKARL
jgi:hypothetical protein